MGLRTPRRAPAAHTTSHCRGFRPRRSAGQLPALRGGRHVGPGAATVISLANGDTDLARRLAEFISQHATDVQRRGYAIRLRTLARHNDARPRRRTRQPRRSRRQFLTGHHHPAPRLRAVPRLILTHTDAGAQTRPAMTVCPRTFKVASGYTAAEHSLGSGAASPGTTQRPPSPANGVA